MVNDFGPEEQQARPVGERYRSRPQPFRGPVSHHHWGTRLSRLEREEMRSRLAPVTLKQLEDLANRVVAVMEKHVPKSDEHYQIAMRLLREQYNLNFAMVGDNCKGAYNPDELSAPER